MGEPLGTVWELPDGQVMMVCALTAPRQFMALSYVGIGISNPSDYSGPVNSHGMSGCDVPFCVELIAIHPCASLARLSPLRHVFCRSTPSK